MTVNFHTVSYAPKYNFKTSNLNFKGDNTPVKIDYLEKINKIGELAPKDRASALNTIAILIFNDPIKNIPSSENLVQAAIVHMPQEDEAYSASRYIVEILRLIKYATNDTALVKKLQNQLCQIKHDRCLDKAIQGFNTSSYNIAGVKMSEAEAGYYTDKQFSAGGRKFNI